MTTVAGLDLSLTSTGLVLVLDNGEAYTHTVTSKGKKGASVAETAHRLSKLTNDITRWLYDFEVHIDLAVIEAPSFGSTTGSQHERGGLWWSVAMRLHSFGVPIAAVSPQGRAKYATGKGNAGKDVVLAAAVRRYVDIDITGNDVADAVILAAMGKRHVGEPIDDVTGVSLDAIGAVKWP